MTNLIDQHLTERLNKIQQIVIGGENLSATLILCSKINRDVVYAKTYGEYTKQSLVLKSARLVGSTLKIALYSAFLDRFPIPLTTNFSDYPITIKWQNRVLTPRNSDNKFRGKVELSYAFANSINTIAMQIIQKLGVTNFIHYLRRCGISCPLPNSPLLALGPIRLTGYELLATLSPILYNGHLCLVGPKNKSALCGESLISEYTIAMMRQLLIATVNIGTAKYLSNRNYENLLGGKTGTSDACKDFWFIGEVNSDLYGLVWLGKEDESSIKTSDGYPASASRFAVPLWAEILECFRGLPVNRGLNPMMAREE